MLRLEQHTIFLTLAGSHAHGTARDGSDVDLRGVCVAPLDERLSLFKSFEQYEGLVPDALRALVTPRLAAHPTARRSLDTKIEAVVYDVAKFVRLCAAANPNALEILFADERDWVLETPAWRRLHEERRRFLTRKVQQTFLGYAIAQLNKIKSHRSRLLTPPGKTPARDDSERPANQTRKSQRNPARAALERAHGYDTKHAMHLVRLMRLGLEVLERGELLVRRPDAAELSAIRDGALSFDELLANAAGLEEAMKRAAAQSTLPEDVDYETADRLAVELMLEATG